MKKIVASGKTIEDAISSGLNQLQANREQVSVTVLEQPSRGLFGLIGVREAKVELTLVEHETPTATKETAPAASAPAAAPSPAEAGVVQTPPSGRRAENNRAVERAETFIRDVAAAMGLTVSIERRSTRDGMLLSISGSGDLGMLIGRRGQTLDALQYLATIVANRHADSHLRFVLDAEDFRERRRKTLEELSDRLAGRVVRSRKEVVLEPMPPQERKIIHSQLQDHPKVKTYSKGDEPNRRVVITLK